MERASEAYDYPLLIKHLLITPLATAPAQEIVGGNSHRHDYRAFRGRIGRLAQGLTKLGIARGDTVAVMDWDSHRFLECFFAVPMMGAILHTINVRLSPEQVLYTINHAEDDILLVHADFMPLLEQISDRIERPIKTVLLHDEGAGPPPAGHAADYEALLEASDPGFAFADFDEATPATTFYTTGTTGDPKGVTYSHRQIVLHTLGLLAAFSPLREAIRLHKGDVYMPMTPLFHVHGWGVPYVATLLGLKQVYPGRYDPARFLDLIAREGVTFSHCVPTILQMLLSAAATAGSDLAGLKVIVGGSALSQGLAKAATERGVEVFSAYGMSETCPFLSVADLTEPGEPTLATRCHSGRPGPLVELRVVDAELRDLPRDGKTTGEIVVRAPWLTQGYVKNPQGSDTLWRGGYLHTGDVGYLDASGALHITDRIKDVIKSGGEWISSLELEDIVSGCDGVLEVAAIGLPDQQWGERPMLLVVRSLEQKDALTAAVLREAIQKHVESGRLSKWALPERVEFVEALDKTSLGKLDKKVLRARYADGGN